MRRLLFVSVLIAAAPAAAQTSPSATQSDLVPGPQTSPSAGRPNLPSGAPVRPEPVPYAPPKPGSPVVQQLVGGGGEPLVVRRHAARPHGHARYVVRHRPVPLDLERPALAGVTLLQPLPPAPQPPHVVVPLPDYPLDTVAASFLTPAPPIVCHRTPRIRDLPDPRLYKEETLVCEPDNP
ncbi:MAG: hypothetical protein INR64_17740 [Caulobacteraceae bacterium]|nr:hypothetical protein [Caulobacter sp.]